MERTNAVAPDCRPLRPFHDVLHFLEESLALLEVGNHGMFARYVAGRHGDRLRSFLALQYDWFTGRMYCLKAGSIQVRGRQP